ncbi:MAG: hypothetical protein HZA78_10410 [Candidatus Schekmanbacteria bacterium]|nr:hypothetical protein [Candidatus Schekmanbacteria bacterium]
METNIMVATNFPPNNPDLGTLWFNSESNQFFMYNGIKWIETRLDELPGLFRNFVEPDSNSLTEKTVQGFSLKAA